MSVSEYGVTRSPLPLPWEEDWVDCPTTLGYVYLRNDKIKVSFNADDYTLEGTYTLDGESLVIAWGEGICVYKKIQSV